MGRDRSVGRIWCDPAFRLADRAASAAAGYGSGACPMSCRAASVTEPDSDG
jgi:hypothetical protein